jgi:Ca2+-binding EF-hand superfamily protein
MDNYDRNKDGYIDKNEADYILNDALNTAVTISDAEDWIKRYDFNNDGRLSIREVADALDLI